MFAILSLQFKSFHNPVFLTWKYSAAETLNSQEQSWQAEVQRPPWTFTPSPHVFPFLKMKPGQQYKMPLS